MRIKQSEVYDKVLVTEFCVFFAPLKAYFKKKSHHFSRLTTGYLWEEYEKFWFFIMCRYGSVLVDIPS